MVSASRQQASKAVKEWQDSSGNLVTDIEPLSGTGNETFLLTQENQQPVVLRINGATDHLGVNRHREATILRLLETENLSPTLLYTSTDFWVFSFVGKTGVMNLANLASTLRRLHQIDTRALHGAQLWTPLDTIHDYLDLEPIAKPLLHRHLAELEDVWQNTDYSLCHLDLNPGNIIHRIDRTIFVDWEYARVSPTIFDIAVLAETHGWSGEEIAEFVALYPAELDTQRLQQSRLAYRIIELLWLNIHQAGDWSLTRLEQAAQQL